MRRLILIHGSFGHPEENWFPSIRNRFKGELEVIVPQFGSGTEQTLDGWRSTLIEAVGELRSDDILVGHSIGCAFIAQVLNGSKNKIAAALLVSPFMATIGIDEFDQVNDTFVNTPVDWPTVCSKANTFKLWHGSDDPYVNPSLATEFANSLQAELHMVEGGGHLNETAGFTKFEPLEKQIADLL